QGNPKETRQRVDALDALAAEQDVPPFEWTLKRLDTGEKVEVLVRLGAIDVQGEVFIQVVAHDMTEEYRMMRTLRESEENLRITLESIGDAVIATDTNGCVSRMNQIALDLTGWDLDDAKGQPLEEVFHIINCDSRKRVDNPVALVLATGQIQGLANHTVLISKRGTEYHIADSAAPIRNDDGEILGVVMVFQDVTEQHLLQERLNHSQKMESIGQLAGGVAHDFNNILAGIMGHAELLVNEIPKESMPQSYLSSIISSCDRAADLVSQLLNFARKGKILSSAIDLHEIISESEQLLRTTMDKSISIRSDLTASVSSVVGDPTQLQSMILNLAINARDVMPHGGEFVIHTENITLNEAYCRISEFDVAPGDYLLLSVRDTGCGISAEVLPHIFDPFFTTKPTGEGTGLGLASIHGVVTSHHGAICVYSEEGTGSEFHIYLPVSDNAVPIAPVVHPGEPKGGGETILLIDDEPMIRNMAWSILSDMGYTVLLAENGRRGVELYRDNIETIDLVVLDMIMPVLSGRETFGELHEINPAVKVVMASGFAHDDRIEEMLSLGAKQFVRKPFRIGQFAYALRAALDEE
ncbi:MAG: PAS domain S-box protein, partial [Phycisphaerales bacterium]|nr:PAS domain S-box protein [Phycisphaerales bacterium]